MSKLHQYLEKIAQGQAINYPVFIKTLPIQWQIDHHHLFETDQLSATKYQVTVIDNAVFAQLRHNNQPAHTRTQAAAQGDSHQQATSHSFLLVYHNQLKDARPDVVLINSQQLWQNFTAKQHLLIIENQENFFHYQQMLPVLSQFYGLPLSLANCDVVFGAGNQINKGLNLSLLGQYHSVLCAFDFDYGGLQMFKSLQQQLAIPVTLLMPDDFSPWLCHFKRQPNDPQHLLAAIDLAGELGFKHLAKVFKKQSRFMEQELLLTSAS